MQEVNEMNRIPALHHIGSVLTPATTSELILVVLYVTHNQPISLLPTHLMM